MVNIKIPYGRTMLEVTIDDRCFLGSLTSNLHEYRAELSQEALVKKALAQPVGVSGLAELAKDKKRIVIITSDHTRPLPSKIITPLLLREIRRGNPQAAITILVGTGCHRKTTKEELIEKFGEDIVAREKIEVHDCDESEMAYLGKAPSGGEVYINHLAVENDLLVAEGVIEPHFFAGFSGGYKSIVTGVASRKTVLYNHNAEFIAHPAAKTGVVLNNPIQEDINYAGKKAKLAFICNVIVNAKKEIVYAVAGKCDLAHKQGCDFLAQQCSVKAIPADIVITSNGGYPLDQNVYQAVKGMTAAEATVKDGGIIIMCAASEDGVGGEEFYKTLAEEKDLAVIITSFTNTAKENTRVDQWQSQIFARVLKKAQVIYVSKLDEKTIRDLHMLPAASIEEALKKARQLLNNPQAGIVVIPDGVAVVVK